MFVCLLLFCCCHCFLLDRYVYYTMAYFFQICHFEVCLSFNYKMGMRVLKDLITEWRHTNRVFYSIFAWIFVKKISMISAFPILQYLSLTSLNKSNMRLSYAKLCVQNYIIAFEITYQQLSRNWYQNLVDSQENPWQLCQ